jgi:hypothetical protein
VEGWRFDSLPSFAASHFSSNALAQPVTPTFEVANKLYEQGKFLDAAAA